MSDDALTVVGTNGGITEKANGWFEVAVAIPGKQYPVKLSTKKSEIVDAVRELGAGEVGTFSYKETESDRINPHTEKPYINRYLEGVEKGGTVSTASGSSSGGGQGGDVDWDSKERRDFRSRAWAHTLGAFGHTIKVDEDPMLVFARLHSFQQAIYQDIVQELAQGTPAQRSSPWAIPTSRRMTTTISPSESDRVLRSIEIRATGGHAELQAIVTAVLNAVHKLRDDAAQEQHGISRPSFLYEGRIDLNGTIRVETEDRL